ncbi:MAG: SUMF1/EgtB/PvdO family nonheme iron enzyme, partial [Saprospiraceae bacterium]
MSQSDQSSRGQSRQLAAILFADIMGFTGIMEKNEMLAMELRDKLKKNLDEQVRIHGGRVIKYAGDGALCSFNSASESVRAGIAVQLEMQLDPKVPLRMGIHQADVIFEASDVFGDGVNIAARLESLAIPGSIFFSAKVYDDIKNQSDIQSISLGKYVLKNVEEPVEIFAVSNPGIQVPLKKKLEGKGIKYSVFNTVRGKKQIVLKIILPVLLLGLLIFLFAPSWIKKQTARKEWIPEIQKLTEDNFFIPGKAFELAKQAEQIIPGDSTLANLWPIISQNITIETDPMGADVYWKDYDMKDWHLIGKTPIINEKFPRSLSLRRIKVEKPGFKTIYNPNGLVFRLDSLQSYPDDMVKVRSAESGMNIIGLEQHGGKLVGDFLMDRHEVTNKDFKLFVDAGGYLDKKYWEALLLSKDNETNWQTVSTFIDKTGKYGPSTWEVGTYPDGKVSHPVTGVSWYEAMAYAKWKGKQLPTVYHWSMVANMYNTWGIIPHSNFNGQGTVPVESMDGISNWGVYDIAGNAREWCFNESDKKDGHRFILGGGWNDPTYAYNDGYIQSMLDRSPSNGFRCMQILPGDTTLNNLSGKIEFAFRDYAQEKPVDDKTFEIFKRQYAYDHTPLNPSLRVLADSGLWKIDKIDLDAAYGKERMTSYLFIPANFSPPYQVVVFFPGSGVIYNRKFEPNPTMTRAFDYILKSGRAVLYPILKGTFERGDGLNSDLQEPSKFYKDHVISWVQDINRS